MKIFVENNDVAIIKITGDDNKVWAKILIDRENNIILMRTEAGEIKSQFLQIFPYKKEVLFWEYKIPQPPLVDERGSDEN